MKDEQIEQQARQALDQSTHAISPEIRQRLYEARQAALSNKKKSTTWFKRPVIGFAIAASFSAILLVSYVPEKAGTDVPDLASNTAEEFMLLTSFDETDMEIAEDLEFAYWLSEQLEHEPTPEVLSSSELRNG